MGKLVDLTGNEYGVLKVVQKHSGGHDTRWLCECSRCGRESVYRTYVLKGPREECYRCKEIEYVDKGEYYEGITRNGSFKLDKGDYEKCRPYIWGKDYKGYVVYNYGGNVLRIRMHRFILNAPDDVQVDHINGDKSDNRRANLRVCTPCENAYNRKVPSNNTSGFKGVRNVKGRWAAGITVNKKYIHLGYFDDIQEAAAVRKEAEDRYHGEFAYKN
jgi:hypothetical protein